MLARKHLVRVAGINAIVHTPSAKRRASQYEACANLRKNANLHERPPVNDCDNLSNSKNHNPQDLADWPGDVASLVREMKRRAGVRTDQELARFLGAAQSTVANWKQRGAVPEAALLKFEEVLARTASSPSLRFFFARAVAMRIPEVWHDRFRNKSSVTRYVPYITSAMSFNAIVAMIAEDIAKAEIDLGKGLQDIVTSMLEDEEYLGKIVDWLKDVPMSDMIILERDANEKALMRSLGQ